PISSTFCECAPGIFMVFVKYTIYDASRVPEFLVHFYEFDILTSYIMTKYKPMTCTTFDKEIYSWNLQRDHDKTQTKGA
ncbi:MAG: hypothetical protein ACKPKO_65825, partial [Candidatus Fonsibacter sp.]